MGIPPLPPQPRVCLVVPNRPSYPSISFLSLSDHNFRLCSFPTASASCGHARKTQTSQDGSKLYLFCATCASHFDRNAQSARIAPPPVSGATRHVRANGAKNMDWWTRVETACVRPARLESSAVLTNVKANFRHLRRLLTPVCTHGSTNLITSLIFPCRVSSQRRRAMACPIGSIKRHSSWSCGGYAASIPPTRRILAVPLLSTSTWLCSASRWAC